MTTPASAAALTSSRLSIDQIDHRRVCLTSFRRHQARCRRLLIQGQAAWHSEEAKLTRCRSVFECRVSLSDRRVWRSARRRSRGTENRNRADECGGQRDDGTHRGFQSKPWHVIPFARREPTDQRAPRRTYRSWLTRCRRPAEKQVPFMHRGTMLLDPGR